MGGRANKKRHLSEMACAESEPHFSFDMVMNGGRQRLMGEPVSLGG